MKLARLVLVMSAARLFSAPTDEADRAALLKGVNEINTNGVPGGVCAFGPDAFAVVAGKDGDKAMLPVVAAARLEKGRVVAFGHDGFLSAVDGAGSAVLLENVARWVSGNGGPVKIGVIHNPALADHLKAKGLEVLASDDRPWSAKLDGLNAVFVSGMMISNDDVAPLEKFVRAGGGLVTGVTGWGWVQIRGGNDDKRLATGCPANLLIQRAGLAFSAGTPDRTRPKSFATGGELALLNAGAAWNALTDQAGGKSKLAPAQLFQCSATLMDAVRSLPPGDQVLLPKIHAIGEQLRQVPTPEHPLRADQAQWRLLVALDVERSRATKPEQLAAHPAAEIFPGAVPPSAPRVNDRSVEINTAVPQWHSTGLYAAPGEAIDVTLPPEAVNKGLAVRIGCHTDRLWHLDAWKRVPEISCSEPLKLVETVAANAFGGLIYIDVPDKSSLGVIKVKISGAVEAPHFILGKTGDDDWKNRIRNFPAPWAELETGKVILSVPSEKIRLLDDPEALMKLWDRILDAEADLSTIPHERKRPERIVPDVQISGGYLHSGYPIMSHLDHTVDQSLSLAELSAGSWGHFHELGHNHQQGDWTFDGTTEVTCNLYSLYVMETVCGLPPGQGHEAMEPAAVAKRLREHLAAGDKFKRWKSDPFLALIMYNQLRVGFGWDTFKKVFAEYRALPQNERPKNDDEKRDQWLVRFSKAAGKNLGPFFEAWGVPTSEAARQSIADLPEWMPDEMRK